MKTHIFRALLLASMTVPAVLAAAEKEPINAPPTLSDWQAMAKLADIGGVWTPLISDQVAQERTNPPP
jgi:predicted exporter